MSETDYTTITVREQTKERLDEHRDGKPWDQYLETLRREHADPITFNDAEQIADAVVDALELDTDHDFDALAREVASNIDYAELANKVADELEGRMR